MLALSDITRHATSEQTIKTRVIASGPTSNQPKETNQSASPQIIPFKSSLSAADSHLRDAVRPGAMAFNNAQTAHWAKHTPPQASTKVKKLAMLQKIAYDQETAGVHFNGHRSFAQAQASLMGEQSVQTSQAATATNPLGYIFNSIKNLASDFVFYIEGNPTTTKIVEKFSNTIGDTKYNIVKSESLKKREANHETILSFGIGLVDTGHSSISVQNGIKAFLQKRFFRPERGDIFLTEAVSIITFENGIEKMITPSLQEHHTYFCMGVLIQFCQFLQEPEKETGVMMAVMAEKRDLVNRIFEFLMNSILPGKAFEARQKLNKRNQKITTPDTEFKVALLIEYQDYCDPAKKKRLDRRIDPLTDATKKDKAAQAAAGNARDKAYYNQITEALKRLKPVAKLYYTLGENHFERLDTSLNKIDTLFINIDNPKQKNEL